MLILKFKLISPKGGGGRSDSLIKVGMMCRPGH